jgi:hypothetical protein
MSALTIVMLVLVALSVIGLYVLNRAWSEFEHLFVYMTWAVVLVVVGASVYLFFAMPTFAEPGAAVRATSVQQDTSNLFQE